jgi:hypothetical protein
MQSICSLVALFSALALLVQSRTLLESSTLNLKQLTLFGRTREVTYHLDEDMFIEQVSCMRVNNPLQETVTGMFVPEEVNRTSQVIRFKLFDFSLMERVLALSPAFKSTCDTAQSSYSVQVASLPDLVVMMFQPLAAWLHMPVERNLASHISLPETFDLDFQIEIDLSKCKCLRTCDLRHLSLMLIRALCARF